MQKGGRSDKTIARFYLQCLAARLITAQREENCRGWGCQELGTAGGWDQRAGAVSRHILLPSSCRNQTQLSSTCNSINLCCCCRGSPGPTGTDLPPAIGCIEVLSIRAPAVVLQRTFVVVQNKASKSKPLNLQIYLF